MEARRSGIHGRGVFALRKLPSRKRLGTLGGKVVALKPLLRSVEQGERIYLVELPGERALDCRRGSVFRFLNHRCEPNCFLRRRGDAIEVYSLRAIGPGEELTVDYGCTPHTGGMLCGCGAARCRKVI